MKGRRAGSAVGIEADSKETQPKTKRGRPKKKAAADGGGKGGESGSDGEGASKSGGKKGA